MLVKLKKAWLEEPILTRSVAPLVLGIVAYLISKHIADAQLAELLLGLAVTLAGGGAFSARGAVWPEVKLPDAARALLRGDRPVD